jgi:hypothetical protein
MEVILAMSSVFIRHHAITATTVIRFSKSDYASMWSISCFFSHMNMSLTLCVPPPPTCTGPSHETHLPLQR